MVFIRRFKILAGSSIWPFGEADSKYLCWFHNNTQVTCVPSKDTEEALRGFGITCPLVVVGRGGYYSFFTKHRSESLRQQWGVDSDTRVMLYVGRLSPEKKSS